MRVSAPDVVLLGVAALLVSAIFFRARPRRRHRRRRRHSFFYRWYMGSSLWRLRRWVWYHASNRRCEGCGRRMCLHRRGIRYRMGSPVMTVHHRNYRRLGHEHRSDVSLLCWSCHRGKDAWRHR